MGARIACMPRQKTAGLSLIEMLIALVIISVGLLGMAGLQAYSLRNNTSAYHRSQATFLAYQIFDAMRVNREAALDGGYTVSLGKDLGTGSRAAVDVLVWQEQIAYWLPGGQGGIACAAIEPVVCTVILQWNDARVEGAGSTQQVSVSTRL